VPTAPNLDWDLRGVRARRVRFKSVEAVSPSSQTGCRFWSYPRRRGEGWTAGIMKLQGLVET